MTKSLRFILVTLLFANLLAACAGPTAAPTAAAPTVAAPTAAPVAAAKLFKVAVVLPSPHDDLSFSQSMYDALVKVKKDLGADKFDFAYSENLYSVDDAASAMRDYASKGYDLVIAHSSLMGSVMPDIAKDFPKTSFAWGTDVDTFESKGIHNVFAYEARAEQGGYVNGVMAALLSKGKNIGVVGPLETGDAKLYVDGFKLGVQATDPKATVNVTWIGTFNDSAKASAAAQTLVNAGADILTGSSQAMAGTVSVAKDKKALYFGTQADQSSWGSTTVVASQAYDWSPFIEEMVSLVQSGTLGGKVFSATLKNGGLVIAYSPDANMPADVKAAADKTIQGIKDGSITVKVP